MIVKSKICHRLNLEISMKVVMMRMIVTRMMIVMVMAVMVMKRMMVMIMMMVMEDNLLEVKTSKDGDDLVDWVGFVPA